MNKVIFQGLRGDLLVFLRFPFGGGSSAGVYLKVIVLLMTCLTLTESPLALLGDSMYRKLHSDGEKGERIVCTLWGELEVADSGIRRRCNEGSSVEDREVVDAAGDGRVAEPFFEASSPENEVLIELDGIEVGERRGWSNLNRGNVPVALEGLANAGDKVLRNSVYARGGEIGVWLPSARLEESLRLS